MMPRWDRRIGDEDLDNNFRDGEPGPSCPTREHPNKAHSQQNQSPQTPASNSPHSDCYPFISNHAHMRTESMTSSVSSTSSVTSLPPLTLISSASIYDTGPPPTPPDLLRDLAQIEPNEYLSLFEEPDRDEVWMTKMWRAHRLAVKEGKKPQRSICYDALIADLPDNNTPQSQTRETSGDDGDEWWGLDYAVELSRNEHDELDTSSFPAVGEHSKSRKSWAAIHQACTHPLFQNEEFQRWKLWHRFLENREEQRKINRLQTFFEFSLLYVQERKLREWMFWQSGKQTEVPEIDEVRRRVNIISIYRPDPYVPPIKRDVAWLLKRSRSVGSLRELAC